ncbi:cytosine deaminase [Dickeya dianthicola]|uniref:cytosine deaminase n=1 Tax=Dickeya dianthicola TaxID=204039 RepID=UPI0003AAE6AC|nr:cytosine deaminase [Dickeya dianthicola]ATO34518.1 Cytosine deaminase [Dickeya dianthicola RNS04.9]MBT1433416.1 cytosine deaminase [Dickeya dianthicola]MCA7001754.1 cytosine deaminase [Dickeya dianthicola]MCI4153538.1 cytosine deaminase [Dickeya dianthicola]MCI4214502.1 cytosine deaminase [Dickeya dianthicola]
MKIINAALRHQAGLHTLRLQDGLIAAVDLQPAMLPATPDTLDAAGQLAIPPLVEPHIHLDAVLTAGEPEWNMSGTLFEGIERWSQRKAVITHEDAKRRAHTAIGMLRDHGIQHVRTHVDVTDPSLAALEAMLEVKNEASGLIDLQIVAFPQEGIESYPAGRQLMERAIALGADVVGGIPHFENTREQGVSSVKFLMELAERTGCLVDVHCDETDDPNSRFLEVLAEETRVRDMGARVTASHTVAMGSYDNAYCSKLFRLLRRSGLSFISCPTESIHLQGRFDTFPKRRGVTRVAELDRAGMNVCFGQDSIKDPWYPLGNGNILRILDAGLHICHMMGYQDLQRCLDFVTDNSAKALHLGDRYGLAVGRPANLLILDAENDYDAVRRQAKARLSIRHGKIIMQREPERIRYPDASR